MTRRNRKAPATDAPDNLATLPSVDRLLAAPALAASIRSCGRPAVTRAIRNLLDEQRQRLRAGTGPAPTEEALLATLETRLARQPGRGPRRVFNLTGTVIHTNLGRAPLPRAALDAIATAAGACDLEYDLAGGERGDRDSHTETLIRDLTGAEAATVVNNNAAAVLLVLNTFAMGREVPVSRGELVEIGGAFRMPEIMARAGARLVEVGTTNRTHPRDFEAALGPDTGMVMKVHPSNYAIEGFTREVDIRELASICRARDVPLAYDLGSGSLVDMTRFGLPREPMPADALDQGADLVTFSGDKLLGGPQAGIIVGRREAVEAVRRNPLKRALRAGKLTHAALAAVLRLYASGDDVGTALPVLRLLSRPADRIRPVAETAAAALAERLGDDWDVTCTPLASQIGSGALPVDTLSSWGVALAPSASAGRGRRLQGLLDALRGLPVPVIGRIRDDRLLLDCRCLEDTDDFVAQLGELRPA